MEKSSGISLAVAERARSFTMVTLTSVPSSDVVPQWDSA